MLDWAAERKRARAADQRGHRAAHDALGAQRARWLSDGGLCYFIRHNHDGDARWAGRERYGIDAFLLHGRDASLFPPSQLSMGVPFWDYWLPQHVPAARPPAAGHRVPGGAASQPSDPVDARQLVPVRQEFAARDRGAEDHPSDVSWQMSGAIRRMIEGRKIALRQHPTGISDWVRSKFRARGSKTLIQIGSHQGNDTEWMAALPDVTVHAFEPDPRNRQRPRSNVVETRAGGRGG